jgi:hypothetical protein
MDIMILPVEGDEATGWKIGKPTPFLSTPFTEQEPMFSPDGHWLAYHSNASGGLSVFVRPFPSSVGQQQVSSGTAAGFPMWSRTRPELLYLTFGPPQVMVAPYSTTGESFRADRPRPWSPGRYLSRPRIRAVNLHPDGRRVALGPGEDPSTITQDKLVIVFNIFDELRRLAPAK